MQLFNENDLTQPRRQSGNHSRMLALIDCTGDICLGDTIQFAEAVFGGSYRKPRYLGDRTITAKVVNDSYGKNKQQHTFTLEIISAYGYDAYSLVEKLTIRRKGRNIYRNGTKRMRWPDENKRSAVLSEKHARGDAARVEIKQRKDEFYDCT